MIGVLFRKALLESKEFLEGIIQPDAGGRAAEEIVVLCEGAPDFARILDLRLAYSVLRENQEACVWPWGLMMGRF